MTGGLWTVLLVKDFRLAKGRLAPALAADARQRLARTNAERALAAASAVGPVLVVTSAPEPAELGAQFGARVARDPGEGQNPAARLGISQAVELGAQAVLVLSSDLPLLAADDLRDLLRAVPPGPCAVAAAATGRGGTNALFLRPPEALSLHFGDRSLEKFQAAAAARRLRFLVHEAPALALDLDEPADLAQLEAALTP